MSAAPGPAHARESRAEGGFNHRLESLRGVAAMMVAMGHAFLVLDATPWPGVLHVANGHAAVRLFFVLSGYVLGLALGRMEGPVLSSFMIFSMRRLLRIGPAFVVATAVVAAWLWLTPPAPAQGPSSPWFNLFYRQPLTWAELGQNMMFQSASLNCVTWTLRVEILGSVLLGAAHFLTRHWRTRGRLMVLLALVLASCCFPNGSLLPYLFMFWLGYMLPEFPLVRRTDRLRWLEPSMLALGLLLFLRSHQTRFELWGEPVGATLILACMVHGRSLAIYRFLDLRVVRLYGRISYSFYLLHFPVIYLMALAELRWLPADTLLRWPNEWAMLLGVGSVLAVTPLAWLMHARVEKPGITLSRWIADGMRGRAPSRVVSPEVTGLLRAQDVTAVRPASPLMTGK